MPNHCLLSPLRVCKLDLLLQNQRVPLCNVLSVLFRVINKLSTLVTQVRERQLHQVHDLVLLQADLHLVIEDEEEVSR